MAHLQADPTLYKSAKTQLIEERGTSRHGRTTYKYCRKHDRVEEIASKCFHVEHTECDAPTVRVFQPYFDPNIGPKTHNGLPVYVRSSKQRKELLKANNLVEIG